MCNPEVAINGSHGRVSCTNHRFTRRVDYPSGRSFTQSVGTREDWVRAKLSDVLSKHIIIKRA